MIRVLFVAEQCNPQWSSVPLVAYHLWDALSDAASVHLVTHIRNRTALETVRRGREIAYIDESPALRRYALTVERLTAGKNTNWPLYHALSYPVYAAFNRKVRRRYQWAVEQGVFDVVHAFSPVLPRYPVGLAQATGRTPFVLGPVNGGLPFPHGFGNIYSKEHGYLNFLRNVAGLLPGYAATYRKAALILAGSCYTLSMLTKRFPEAAARMELFHSNGIAPEFFHAPERPKGIFTILFVGRLAAYKGADILLEAFARSGVAGQVVLVGDGPERRDLEERAQALNIARNVRFAGWVAQRDTEAYYRQAHVFAFPSIREFGGTVALEAMAAGLPCVVADYGGIGEFVDDACGFRIAPVSREHMVRETAAALRALFEDENLRLRLGAGAAARAGEFLWSVKARKIAARYARLLAERA